MAFEKLTPAKAYLAKAWIHDVLVLTKTISPSKSETLPDGSTTAAPTISPRYMSDKACQTVVDELVKRNFTNIDSAVQQLAWDYFTVWDSQRRYWKYTRIKNDLLCAKFIVHFALANGIYWDDTIRSVYEIETFEKTLLGQAVKAMGAYVSNIAPAKTPKTSKKSTTTTTNTTAAGVASQAGPKNNYKSSGPQSAKVRDLKGIPGVKKASTFSYPGNYMFKIEGTNANAQAVKPVAHIKPLSAVGEKNGTNKVFLGSANGYTDCTCYFNDPVAADSFLSKCVAIAPSNITNLHVVKSKADPNGYFLVGTEFGEVAIAARKLNEAIAHEVCNNEDNRDYNYKPYDLDEYLQDNLKFD